MSPELIKAFTEAGIGLTIVIIAGFLAIRLIGTLFTFLSGAGSGSSMAWKEAIELLQGSYDNHTRTLTEHTNIIRELAHEIKEDRRFWVQQITTAQANSAAAEARITQAIIDGVSSRLIREGYTYGSDRTEH